LIRTAWFLAVASAATLAVAPVIFVAWAFGHRGLLYDRLARWWSRTLLRASGSTLAIHDFDRVDWSRPYVVVCNHTGAFEILALAVTIPVRYRFVAKKELERVPVFGPAWKMAGHVSLDRSDRERAVESLREAAHTLRKDGGVVVIFPEGTRSRDGQLGTFKKGAFMLAIEAQVPILPTIAVGSSDITPPGVIRVTPGHLDLFFGEPIPVAGVTPERADELIAIVHEKMREMLASDTSATTGRRAVS
jgi:1-acyl-sn-glycerol-3-phosphate acyltransferase